MKAKSMPQIHQSERLALHEHIPLATPLVLYLEPSGFCNLKCAFCPHSGDGKELKKDVMSVELFEKLMNDASEFPGVIKLMRVCGNGEPLTNKNILEMMQIAREKNVVERIELVTNGVLLTPDLTKNLPRLVDRIVISIEGLNAEEYQKTCKATINFQKLLDNIDELYAHKGECTIHVKVHNEAVLTESRKKEFFEMFGNRCDEICIEKLVPMWPQFNSDYYSTDEFRWGGEVAKRKVCAQIFKGVQVQANGEVVACCVDWKRLNLLGDANKESLLDIWNAEKLKKLRIKHLAGNKGSFEPCKDCTMNDYCEIDDLDSYAEQCIQRL